MPSFLTPGINKQPSVSNLLQINKQPSVSNLLQTINNQTPSNYIAPSNTDDVKPFDYYTCSFICCGLCILFIHSFFPIIAGIIGYMQGIPLNGPNPYLTMYIFGIPYVQKDVIIDNSGLVF
jgi:hypothetical protein